MKTRSRFVLMGLGLAVATVSCGGKKPPATTTMTDPAPDSATTTTVQPASTTPAPTGDGKPSKPLYDRLGGVAAISVVVDDFIEALLVNDVLNANPMIKGARARVPAPYLKYHVTALVCQVTGGPCVYDGRAMKDSHAHLHITEGQWNEMAKVFKTVLDKYNVPAKEQQELFTIVGTTKGDIVTAADTKIVGPTDSVAFKPKEIKWAPGPASIPAGAEMAVVSGSPSAEGPFVMRLRLPAKYKLPPHWHPAHEHVTVIEGGFWLGHGDAWDEKKLTELTPGGFAMMPPKHTHFVMTKKKTVIQVHAWGPWAINYVKAEDDPRNAAKK